MRSQSSRSPFMIHSLNMVARQGGSISWWMKERSFALRSTWRGLLSCISFLFLLLVSRWISCLWSWCLLVENFRIELLQRQSVFVVQGFFCSFVPLNRRLGGKNLIFYLGLLLLIRGVSMSLCSLPCMYICPGVVATHEAPSSSISPRKSRLLFALFLSQSLSLIHARLM